MNSELTDYIERTEQRKTRGNKINAVVPVQDEEDKQEEAKEQLYRWCDHECGFICLSTPAMKRQRTDDDQGNTVEMDLSTGKPKAAPVNGGCFICGGAHFARACPDKPADGKGKGKGKDRKSAEA